MLMPFYPNKLPIQLNPEKHILLLRKAIAVTKSLEALNQQIEYSPANYELIESFSWYESVKSAKLEGTQADFDDVLEAQVTKSKTPEILEVQNYRKALDYGKRALLEENKEISSSLLCELHKIVLSGVRGGKKNIGHYRTKQNWICENDTFARTESESKKNATYIPPAPEVVPELMSNLVEFMKDNDYDPLIAVAIVHAQFETIHPFLDGNGRVGRLLISLYLLQHRSCGTKTIFVSEELEKNAKEYYSKLNKLRTNDPDWYGWIAFFLDSVKKEADKQLIKVQEIRDMVKKYLSDVEIQKSDPAQKILYCCAVYLIFNTTIIINETGFQNATVNKWLKYFIKIGMLKTDSKKRHKVYWFPEVLRIIENKNSSD